MSSISIDYCFNGIQELSDEYCVGFVNCPYCEITHEDSLNCQGND